MGKLRLMVSHIRLGAQQPPFLAAAENKAQAVAVGRVLERFHNLKQPDAAGHIIPGAVGKRRGIIMGGKGDPFFAEPRNFRHHVVGFAVVFPLLNDHANPLHPVLHQLQRFLGVDAHPQNLFALGYVGAKLLLVDVAVLIAHVAVIGDKAHRAVFQQILIQEIANARIQQHDFALRPGQGRRVRVRQIQKLRFYFAAAAALIALAGNGLAIRKQGSGMHLRHGHGKSLQMRLNAHFPAFAH